MLSIDLIRARVRDGQVKPSYIDEGSPQLNDFARQLVDAFRDHVGRTHGELTEAVSDIEGDSTRYMIVRGLAKLLFDRTEVGVDSPLPPVDLRRRLFELSTQARPVGRRPSLVHTVSRADILARVAEELEVTTEQIERGLYADLKDAQVVTEFKAITPDALLSRYNVALAQGVLLRANEMRVDIRLTGPTRAARYRQFFRYLKFYQLLHTITPRPGGGYRIVLDGPASVLRHSGKYGFKMACFLPALLLCDGWRLEADVSWGRRRKRCTFKLSHDDGLRSHLRDTGVYLTELETLFTDRFEKKSRDWKLSREEILLPLGGQGLLIPDFRLRHCEDDREAFLEIIGYWRADYLRRRLSLLAERGPANLILAVSDRMQLDKKRLRSLPIKVLRFKRVLRPKLVIEAADEVALPPGDTP